MNKSIRVLILEDSEFDARILISVLRQGGYTPDFQRVEDEAQLREAISSVTWDIILADYNLPEFDALKALMIVQEYQMDLPFIIISGGIGEDVAVAAMKAGANDYLMKGSLARLVPAVERELRDAEERAAHRQAQHALEENEKRYRLLWETSPDAILLIDSNGLIQFANPATKDVFEYEPSELIGRHFNILQPERLRLAYMESVARTLLGGTRDLDWKSAETLARRKNGSEIPVEISIGEMNLDGSRWFVGFVRDTTQRKKAEEALRETEEQFRIAREIQQSLFPKASPQLPGFDISGTSVPATSAGGDYFDYLEMLQGGHGIVVGDVTGHGIGPALLMAETRAYLRVVSRNREDVGLILSRANKVLAEDVGYERYITLLLARLDPVGKSLIYANAGHIPGYIVGADGAVKHKLTRTGMPLGMKPDTEYKASESIQLEQGDVILLMTDGIDEALAEGNESEFFGTDRALDIVRAHAQNPAGTICDAIINGVREFSGTRSQEDDLTLVVVKVL